MLSHSHPYRRFSGSYARAGANFKQRASRGPVLRKLNCLIEFELYSTSKMNVRSTTHQWSRFRGLFVGPMQMILCRWKWLLALRSAINSSAN